MARHRHRATWPKWTPCAPGSDYGYVEGRNLVIELRWADGRLERLPQLAAELVVVNLKTASALGLRLPAQLLNRADRKLE